MSHGGDPNYYIVRWNDSKSPKKCETKQLRYECGHVNLHINRCQTHAKKPQRDEAGVNYCGGKLQFPNGEIEPSA